MTVLQVIGAIVGAITSIYGILKLIEKWTTKPTEQKMIDIANEVNQEKQDTEASGRPQ